MVIPPKKGHFIGKKNEPWKAREEDWSRFAIVIVYYRLTSD